MDTTFVATNEIQTDITKELIDSLADEVRENFVKGITSIGFVRNLINPNRPRIKDLDRDDDGKIVVDLSNPHILEDMDYFRPSAIHFEKHECYTFLRPNSSPNSEYGKWIREEIRRCRYGYVREYDGEWITGDYYFFLNYCPIQQISKDPKNNNRSIRIVGFPRVWDGHYLISHYINRARDVGSHAYELASRGKGKSFFGASLLAKRFILGESDTVNKKVQCVVTASDKKYVWGANQILNMFVHYIDFCAQNTQFPRMRITNSSSKLTWEMGYIDLNSGTRRGTQNSVIGVTSNNNEASLRGARGVLFLFEEIGTFPRLLKLHSVTRPSVEDGDNTFGTIFGYGTAGDSESDFSSAQEILFNPSGYNVLPLPNIYDYDNSGSKEFAFFFPGYLNMADKYDENGNSDVVGAMLYILKDRYKIKYNSTDPNALLKRTAEIPITPREAILRNDSAIFPTLMLNERIAEIDSNPSFYDDVYVGVLNDVKGEIIFTPTLDLPIRDFPHDGNKHEGAIEIYAMPERDSTGKVITGRYIAGFDPVENDESNTTNSLGSLFVLDTFTDRLVLEYTGRLSMTDDLFEIVRRVCRFYNCKVLYENNKKGLFAYFQRMNCVYMLADTPEYLKDKQIIKSTASYGNTSKGVNAIESVNKYARDRLRAWLTTKESVMLVNEDGEEVDAGRPKLYTMQGRAALKELASWNSLGNFDRVSALGILMLYREEKVIYNTPERQENKNNYLGNDPFFEKNYNNTHKKSRHL